MTARAARLRVSCWSHKASDQPGPKDHHEIADLRTAVRPLPQSVVAPSSGPEVREMTYRWKLDCDDYLRNCLSAHANCQLSMRQRLVAELHVRECITCETSLFEERSVKGLVRNTLAGC